PAVRYLGPCWGMHVMYAPPMAPPGPAPATGKKFSSEVSMRQLFQVSGSQPPGPVWLPRENVPGSAMYWPQNDASPATAATAWFVGTCSSTPVTALPPGAMVRPAEIL